MGQKHSYSIRKEKFLNTWNGKEYSHRIKSDHYYTCTGQEYSKKTLQAHFISL